MTSITQDATLSNRIVVIFLQSTQKLGLYVRLVEPIVHRDSNVLPMLVVYLKIRPVDAHNKPVNGL